MQMGRGQDSFPRDSLCDEMDARVQRTHDLRRLMDAIEHLRTYDPHLHHLAFKVCVAGGGEIRPGRGLRHSGAVWDSVVRELYGGDDGALWRHLQSAWSLVAVLAVTPDVLRAAQDAEAVDLKALAWAREQGLVRPPP